MFRRARQSERRCAGPLARYQRGFSAKAKATVCVESRSKSLAPSREFSREKYLAIFATLLLLTFFTSRARADDNVHLRLEVPASGIRSASTAAERAVLTAFKEANPNVVIDPYVRLRIEGPSGEASVYMAIAGQTAPDALYVNGRSMQKYIDQGFLLPLDNYLTDEIKADPFYQKLLPTVSRDGHVYAIPAKVAVSAMLYRKDLFAKAGLNPDQPPRTWDELLADARKLTIPEKGQFGIILPSGVNAGWRFPNFVWQAGGEMVRPTATGYRLSLDDPGALKALEFYKELRWGKWASADGKAMQTCMRVDATGEESLRAVQDGKAAMAIISTVGAVGTDIPDPATIGIAPLPAGPAGPAAMLEGEFWGLNSQLAKDPARRDAAWKFIAFKTGEDAKRITTRVCVEAGQAAAVPPDWLERFGYNSELQTMPKSWLTFTKNMATNGHLEPFAPGYDQVATDVLSQLDDVLFSENADPKTVLQSINDRANSAFFSTTPPEVVAHRRTIARGVVSALAAVLAAIAIIAQRKFAAKRRGRSVAPARLDGPRAADRGSLVRVGILFLAPAVLTIFVWDYYPLASGALLAFLDYRVTGDSHFTGLDNFIAVFNAGTFWSALLQTFVYVAISLSLGFLAPIILAILLSEISFGKIFFRTLFYLPAVTSGVVVLTIWKIMLYDNSPQGVFNQLLAWMSGTTSGRVITTGGFALVWWALVSILAAAVIDWISSRPGNNSAKPNGRAMGGLGVGALSIAPIIPIVPIVPGVLAAGGLPSLDLSPPIAFLFYGVIAAGVVLAATAVVAMFSAREDLAVAGRLKKAAAIGTTIVGLALAWLLTSLLVPQTRPYPWLQDPTGYWAMLWVIIPGIWAGAGPGCIIYLAAIKSIPDELYEAADLDGAGPLHKAYHVTFQTLLPLIVINFIGAVIGTFHAMESVLVLTGGGPANRTMTLGMDIFFNAFTHLKFGYATAQAWVMGSLLIGFTVYQLRSLKQMKFRRAS